jgi:purine-nucleoside/S-methyl-5'-thioadenosine phosphorylase / adenosine deaminase
LSHIALEVGGARIIFTDRHDGVSAPPYDTANLGLATGDDPDAVNENRRRVAEALGGNAADPARWAWVRQVHGGDVVEPNASGRAGDADALVTDTPGLPLLVLVADCAPVALVAGDAIAAVHVGWRGLLAGVLPASVEIVRRRGRVPVRAVVGPCISASHYEFGTGELDRVAGRLGPEVRAHTEDRAPALDLRAGIRAALRGAGVDEHTEVDVCTYASPAHFSHRRDGVTGRQALIVTREP